MSRLIDADALLKGKDDHQIISTHLIWNAPTVDAVQVVRCKDCKYYPDGKLAIMWTPCSEDIRLDGKWFCAYGERREE